MGCDGLVITVGVAAPTSLPFAMPIDCRPPVPFIGLASVLCRTPPPIAAQRLVELSSCGLTSSATFFSSISSIRSSSSRDLDAPQPIARERSGDLRTLESVLNEPCERADQHEECTMVGPAHSYSFQ